MGADQVGVMIVIPDVADIAAGVRHLVALRQDAWDLLAEIRLRIRRGESQDLPEDSGDTIASWYEEWAEKQNGAREGLLADCETAVKELAEWCGDASEKQVRGLLRGIDFRDTHMYPFKVNGVGYTAAYAGTMSWGDEPDGEGYKAIKRLYSTGLADAVGCP